MASQDASELCEMRLGRQLHRLRLLLKNIPAVTITFLSRHISRLARRFICLFSSPSCRPHSLPTFLSHSSTRLNLPAGSTIELKVFLEESIIEMDVNDEAAGQSNVHRNRTGRRPNPLTRPSRKNHWQAASNQTVRRTVPTLRPLGVTATNHFIQESVSLIVATLSGFGRLELRFDIDVLRLMPLG